MKKAFPTCLKIYIYRPASSRCGSYISIEQICFYKNMRYYISVNIKRAFKYRLYPNPEQQAQLARQFGATRFTYNYFLRKRIDRYADTGKGLTYHDTALMLAQLKKESEYSWLKEAHSQVLQQSLVDLDKAYNNFFNKRADFPTFKKKHGKQSCRFPQGFKVSDTKLFVPKIGWINVVLHRPIEGVMKNLTISKTKSGKYFASIQVEQEIDEPTCQGDRIGLDLGLKDFAVTSDGQRFPSPKYLRKSEKRLKRLQRRLSRCQKGSNGRNKARLKVARQHEKIANQRQDFLHKLSKRLVDENQVIVIEDLHVKGMLKNHHLAKSISDSGWSEFVRQLNYKGQWYGCHIEQIDRFFPSSKRCFHCGHVHGGLTLAMRQWVCSECGTLIDRDLNAAQNILNWYTPGTGEIYAAGQPDNLASASGLVESGSPLASSRG
jgi:putative transposase